MADINDILALGLGDWSSVNSLPTLGFSSSTPAYYVDPDDGCDVNGDGTSGNPYRSFWNVHLDRAEAGDTIYVKAGTSWQYRRSESSVTDEKDCSWSIRPWAGTGSEYITFTDVFTVSGANKSAMMDAETGAMAWFRTANGGDIAPVGWTSTAHYGSGYVTAADDDSDGQMDCCEFGADGSLARAALTGLPTVDCTTGHKFRLSADLKGDGSSGFTIGMVVRVIIGGVSRYWDGSAWVTASLGTGTSGNEVKLVEDDDADTFTGQNSWGTYVWDIEIPGTDWALGGTLTTAAALTIMIYSRGSQDGWSRVRNVTLTCPNLGWIYNAGDGLWYYPATNQKITLAMIRLASGYVYRLDDTPDVHGQFAMNNNQLAMYRDGGAGDNPEDDGVMWFYRTHTLLDVDTNDVTIEQCKFKGFAFSVAIDGTATGVTLDNCWFEDSSHGATRVDDPQTLSITGTTFKWHGSYKAWDQNGTYAGAGTAVIGAGAITVDQCKFYENWQDVHIQGDGSGTVQRCLSEECEVNCLWLSGVGGDIIARNNTIRDQGAHGIVTRYQGASSSTNYIQNNIVASTKDYTTRPNGIQIDADSTTTICDYNLTWIPATGFGWTIEDGAGNTNDPDLVFATDGYEEHGIYADPKFVSATDSSLLGSSPAINAGVDVGLTEDLLGNTVPFGSAVDIGAYEVVVTIPSSWDVIGGVYIPGVINGGVYKPGSGVAATFIPGARIGEVSNE